MGFDRQIEWAPGNGSRALCLVAAASATIVIFALRLRGFEFTEQPPLAASINVIGVFLSFTFAANTMVRFRGTHDRMALVLALGFTISALIELGVTADMFGHLDDTAGWFARSGISWTQSRVLLAEALLLAMAFEQRVPHTRPSGRRFIIVLMAVGTVGYFGSAVYFSLMGYPHIYAGGTVPRPWDLLPAGLFLLAAIGFQRRLLDSSSALDHALTAAAWMNFASHLVMLESSRVLDAPSALAQAVRVSSYAVVLGGTLLDNARTFAEVRRLAITDPLTGLANYRHLIDVLEAEVERTARTGREFAVILLDLDGLKKVNDHYGHLVGSRALCRLAETLRVGSRSIDTPARYGGDEFAMVLPETGKNAALGVAERIRRHLAEQPEIPQVSVSTGVAVYPAGGVTAERLLAAADQELYEMKSARHSKTRLITRY